MLKLREEWDNSTDCGPYQGDNRPLVHQQLLPQDHTSVMYACVLIPRSLSLVLTLHPNPGNMLEMSAAVWANVHLHQGHVFFPDEGELRLDQLEVYSVLADNDVSMSALSVCLHCQ